MVGLGEIRQLEVNGESLADLVRILDGEAAYDLPRLQKRLILEIRRTRILMPVLNEKPAQMFDHIEQGLAALFNENLAEQQAQRPDINEQRHLLRTVCRLS